MMSRRPIRVLIGRRTFDRFVFCTDQERMTAKQQLDKFLAKYERDIVSTARGALAIVRKRLPGRWKLSMTTTMR